MVVFMNEETSMGDEIQKKPSSKFVAALLVALAVLLIAIGLALRGLPGLQNSPTATVDGKSMVGKTGN
jgi:hypothetical protein